MKGTIGETSCLSLGVNNNMLPLYISLSFPSSVNISSTVSSSLVFNKVAALTQDLYLAPEAYKKDSGLGTFTWDLIAGTICVGPYLWNKYVGPAYGNPLCLSEYIIFVWFYF